MLLKDIRRGFLPQQRFMEKAPDRITDSTQGAKAPEKHKSLNLDKVNMNLNSQKEVNPALLVAEKNGLQANPKEQTGGGQLNEMQRLTETMRLANENTQRYLRERKIESTSETSSSVTKERKGDGSSSSQENNSQRDKAQEILNIINGKQAADLGKKSTAGSVGAMEGSSLKKGGTDHNFS